MDLCAVAKNGEQGRGRVVMHRDHHSSLQGPRADIIVEHRVPRGKGRRRLTR